MKPDEILSNMSMRYRGVRQRRILLAQQPWTDDAIGFHFPVNYSGSILSLHLEVGKM